MDGSGDLEEREGHSSGELTPGLNILSEDHSSRELTDGDKCLNGELALCLRHDIMNHLSRQLVVWEKRAGSVEGERDLLSWELEISLEGMSLRQHSSPFLHLSTPSPSWFDLSNAGDDLGPVPDWCDQPPQLPEIETSDDESLITDILEQLQEFSNEDSDLIASRAMIVEVNELSPGPGPGPSMEGMSKMMGKGKDTHPNEKGPLYNTLHKGAQAAATSKGHQSLIFAQGLEQFKHAEADKPDGSWFMQQPKAKLLSPLAWTAWIHPLAPAQKTMEMRMAPWTQTHLTALLAH
jgi:hypothetical protein